MICFKFQQVICIVITAFMVPVIDLDPFYCHSDALRFFVNLVIIKTLKDNNRQLCE